MGRVAFHLLIGNLESAIWNLLFDICYLEFAIWNLLFAIWNLLFALPPLFPRKHNTPKPSDFIQYLHQLQCFGMC